VDFAALKASISLETVILKYTTLNQYRQGPCPLCGGRDRFYIHTDGTGCGCRKCGFQGDAVDLVQLCEKITRCEAVSLLIGPEYKAVPEAIRRRTVQIPEKPDGWDARAQRVVRTASAFLASLEGDLGRSYLESRQIAKRTWQSFGIGFAPQPRPAIVIPWYRPGAAARLNKSSDKNPDSLDAVRFRFIDEIASGDKASRFAQLPHSAPSLFGLHALGTRPDLLAIEGEFNALSVWQSCHVDGHDAGIDVLSFGSETPSRCGRFELKEIVVRYERVLIWADRPENAIRLSSSLCAPGRIVLTMRSPRDLDANDILRAYGEQGLLQLLRIRMNR
jgi:hypothetical protein